MRNAHPATAAAAAALLYLPYPPTLTNTLTHYGPTHPPTTSQNFVASFVVDILVMDILDPVSWLFSVGVGSEGGWMARTCPGILCAVRRVHTGGCVGCGNVRMRLCWEPEGIGVGCPVRGYGCWIAEWYMEALWCQRVVKQRLCEADMIACCTMISNSITLLFCNSITSFV